jgi:hypothetical protein
MNVTKYSHLTDDELLRLLLRKSDLTDIEQELMFRMEGLMEAIEAADAELYGEDDVYSVRARKVAS